MKTIYKYGIDIDDKVFVMLPEGYRVLSIQNQGGRACLWAEVDTDAKLIQRVAFRVFGTGHPIPDDVDPSHYTATVQFGALVFHFYGG